MRIAIIDSGIATESTDLQLTRYSVVNGKVCQGANQPVTRFSHGSSCARIVSKGQKEDTEIIGIQIYSENNIGQIENLCIALSWCLGQHLDFINLSNGTQSNELVKEINDLCYQLHMQGVQITAAVSNTWNYTIPACLPYVIGVERWRFLKRKSDLSDVCVGGWLLRRGRNHHLCLETGNSYASARYCRILSKQRKKRPATICLPSWLDFSLLKNIQTWKWSHIDELLLPFPCKTWDSHVHRGEKITILITDDFSSPVIIQSIEQSQNDITSIIWCAPSVPKRITSICLRNGIKIWKEPVIHSGVHKALAIDAFVIRWEGKSDVPQSIIALKKLFSDVGFSVLMLSNTEYSYLYGFLYPPSPKVFSIWARQISPDIVIIDGRNVEKEEYENDVEVIELSPGRYMIRADNTTFNEAHNIYGVYKWICDNAASPYTKTMNNNETEGQ